MALETAFYQQDLFSYNSKDPFNFLGAHWGCDFDDDLATKFDDSFDFLQENPPLSPTLVPPDQWSVSPNASSDLRIPTTQETSHEQTPQPESGREVPAARFKRRRSRPSKNKQEIERQRMAHIAVERNRRKQMNQYLSVLRGLMPDGYVHKSDQASIVGAAIDYVKELEQRLQFLGVQNHMKNNHRDRIHDGSDSSLSSPPPFSEFLTFPRYSSFGKGFASGSKRGLVNINIPPSSNGLKPPAELAAAAADIEVAMVESHANLRVRSKRRPKQLVKMVSMLQRLGLTILHLNVTTAYQTVLYSLSLKVEDDCKLTTADEIASAVNQIFSRVQEEENYFYINQNI